MMHNSQIKILLMILAGSLTMLNTRANAQRQMEYLDRGVIAFDLGNNGVYVSWRLLGSDPANTTFNVYRNAKKITYEPLTQSTNFVDTGGSVDDVYSIRPLHNRKEGDASKGIKPWHQNYLSVPLQTMPGCQPNDASVGDLDGDGEYEIVLHQTSGGRDNSRSGLTDPPVLEAYKLDGTLLWRINLGPNIREGAHYTQFMVYDLDGDGKSEVACKTADGTIDGTGKIIGDANAVYRYPEETVLTVPGRNGEETERKMEGYILKGPEYLTIFDGKSAAELTTTNYIPPRHPDTTDPTYEQLQKIWGDGYGNRVDRFLACVAYLDGKRPSLVMCRGYYTRSVLAAWNWRNGKLTHLWTFDSDDGSPGNEKYRGQGNHNLSVADVDGDGKDEIVYGAAVIDDNGKGLYSTGWGHGDAMHLSDLDPDNPGLEVFNIQERFDEQGMNFRDARTGKALWTVPSVKAAESGGDKGEGPGRGNSFDIDPRYQGAESWAAGAGMNGLYSAKGKRISENKPSSCNFAVWWDGDLLRELLDRNVISKWNWEKEVLEPLLIADECISNNGTKATPVLSGDLFGDWREEVIWRTKDNRELRIYTTNITTKHRFVTLMHDPVYRLAIAWQNVAYNQPPHTSYYIGNDMTAPSKSDLKSIFLK